MTSVRLDVIMPSAAEPRVLERTLAALTAARRVAHHAGRLVVVDDRPRRVGVAELVEGADGVVVAGPGRGPGPARNVGRRAASADWLLFLDDDVRLDADAMAAALRWLAAGPTVPLATGLLRPPPGSPAWVVDGYRHGTMLSVNALRPATSLGSWDVASGCVLVDARALDAVGGFPEPVMGRWEDVLLGARLAARADAHGVVGVVAPGLTGVHAWNPTWKDWRARMEQHGRMAADLVDSSALADHDGLVAAIGQGSGARATLRRTAARLPQSLLERLPGRTGRRVAASAAFTRAFVAARRAGA